MDFHSLSRRELQALCKKNKIPANMTNVAMADALAACETVEGLDEFVAAPKPESLQSTPQIVSRSVSRRKQDMTPDENSQTVGSRIRTTRRSIAGGLPLKNIVQTAEKVTEKEPLLQETPAKVEGSRRKVRAVSTRKQLDVQGEPLNEKKNISETPLAIPKARRCAEQESRTRANTKKEGLSVQPVYSTRRSLRVLEKSMQSLNLEEIENPAKDSKGVIDISREEVYQKSPQLDTESKNTDSDISAALNEEVGDEVQNDTVKSVLETDLNETGDQIMETMELSSKEKSESLSMEIVQEGYGAVEEQQTDKQPTEQITIRLGCEVTQLFLEKTLEINDGEVSNSKQEYEINLSVGIPDEESKQEDEPQEISESENDPNSKPESEISHEVGNPDEESKQEDEPQKFSESENDPHSKPEYERSHAVGNPDEESKQEDEPQEISESKYHPKSKQEDEITEDEKTEDFLSEEMVEVLINEEKPADVYENHLQITTQKEEVTSPINVPVFTEAEFSSPKKMTTPKSIRSQFPRPTLASTIKKKPIIPGMNDDEEEKDGRNKENGKADFMCMSLRQLRKKVKELQISSKNVTEEVSQIRVPLQTLQDN